LPFKAAIALSASSSLGIETKPKPRGASGVAIGRDGGALDAAMRLKQRPELGFFHAEREIADVNLLHFDSSYCAGWIWLF
jgi:hypothetical protein